MVEQLLAGWRRLDHDDDIHLVIAPEAELALPASVTIHRLSFGRQLTISRLHSQNVRLPALCRRLGADILLGSLPTTAVSPLPCPRAIIAHDLRHELRPDQFSRGALLLRRSSYGLGFRQADGVICVSERTRNDVLRSRPWLAARVVRVALHGADHVLAWGAPPTADGDGYAIAFGQYQNKNVGLLLEAWKVLERSGSTLPLVLVGLSDHDRRSVQLRIADLGLGHRVTALPWLPAPAFRERFLSARMVVFPSDFEGFGLPAIEAMRLGIPVVISPDPALIEVTGGYATTVEGPGAEALAAAVVSAPAMGSDAMAAATSHAATFTWERAAQAVRSACCEVVRSQA